MTTTPSLAEATLLVTIVHHPSLLDRHLEGFLQLELASRELDALRQDVAQFIGEPIPEPTDPPADIRSAAADPSLAELRV
ncbi:MAG: hypothetical protein IID38_06555 [Planctomycetes bacterium]|nr:hypothetical protein [Planctomycetota bacterium]